jgi:hypothetical protein
MESPKVPWWHRPLLSIATRPRTVLRVVAVAAFLAMPILAANILPTSCRIGDLMTTDVYLCALNGSSIQDPWLVAGEALVFELIVIAVALVSRRKPRSK